MALDKLILDPDLIPNPSLLLCPNIPKPLHGLNPREIMGPGWWDAHRKPQFAKSGYRCWACGAHKSEGRITKWLDGHEVYKYDYQEGIGEMLFIAGLCRACHNFIHNGRMISLWSKGDPNTSWELMMYVFKHGFTVLKQAGLPPNPYALASYHNAYKWSYANLMEVTLPSWHDAAMGLLPDAYIALAEDTDAEKGMAEWSRWRLFIDGHKYPGKFKSYAEWSSFYNPVATAALGKRGKVPEGFEDDGEQI